MPAVSKRRLAVLRLVDMANADFLERHARHLPHAVLIVDDENLERGCVRHFYS